MPQPDSPGKKNLSTGVDNRVDKEEWAGRGTLRIEKTVNFPFHSFSQIKSE
jgi:hypothetical protein